MTSSTKVDSNNRLDRLEKLVEGLTDTVQKLTTSSNAAFAQPMSSRASICDHCGKSGHNRQSCFKLKTCLKCGFRGHIEKFCRNQNGPRVPQSQQFPSSGRGRPSPWFQANSSAGKTANSMISNPKDAVNLDPAPRIFSDITVGDTPLKFLYDPGSQHTMIPSSIYHNMQHKPTLAPVNKVGIGISGTHFQFDSAAHMNLKFKRPDDTPYILEYGPVLVGPHIKPSYLVFTLS